MLQFRVNKRILEADGVSGLRGLRSSEERGSRPVTNTTPAVMLALCQDMRVCRASSNKSHN